MFWRSRVYKEINHNLKTLFPRLWRYCLLLTASSDRADDLAQTTCLRVLEQARQYQTGTHFDRWVFRIAKNTWFNELRSEAVRRGGGLQHIDEVELPDHVNINPESTTINKQVLSGVLTLPEAQRITVALVYIEGYSYAEASDILDLPIGTVMSRLATARSKLSAQLQHYREVK